MQIYLKTNNNNFNKNHIKKLKIYIFHPHLENHAY